MESVLGGYTAVELKDGRMGNYKVAQQYYRDFDRLRIQSPDKFNRICHSVLAEGRDWIEEDRQVLGMAGLAFTRASEKGTTLSRPEEEIRDFIKLAVVPTIVSRIFGILLNETPDYDLQSPFRNPVFREPDMVPDELQTTVVLDWEGADARDYLGNKLVPDPAARPPRRDLDTGFTMFPPGA